MARARNIKPSFFDNDELAENDPLGRILFIGLWTLCDFKGNLEWRSKRVKKQLLAYDNCDIEKLAINLDNSGFIRFYSDGEKLMVNITNFSKHQNPHKNERDKGSEIPDYSEKLRQLVDLKGLTINRDLSGLKPEDSSSNPADSLFPLPDSLNLIPEDIVHDEHEHEISTEDEFETFWINSTHTNKPLQLGLKKVNKSQSLKSFKAQVNKLPKEYSYSNGDDNYVGVQAFTMMLIDDVAKRCQTTQYGFENNLHPTTYLNNQRWEDEYETSEPINAKSGRKLTAVEENNARLLAKYGDTAASSEWPSNSIEHSRMDQYKTIGSIPSQVESSGITIDMGSGDFSYDGNGN